jgi:NTE family protein
MLAPSVDPREIAARHVADMPQGLRALLRVIGGRGASGLQLPSYLMFEAGYTRDLIKLGYHDAMESRSQLMAFMSGAKVSPVPVVATTEVPQAVTSGVVQAT